MSLISRFGFDRFPHRGLGVRVGLVSLAVLATSCGSTGPTTNAGPKTSNGQTPSGITSTTAAVVVTPQSQVTSEIIVTPEGATASTLPPLADDYVPSPKGESIVLQATVGEVRIYDSATSRTVASTLANPLPSGTPLTFLVDGQTSHRYKVLLPIRPNGSTGWVDPADVGIKRSHKYRIEIDMAAFKLQVFNGDTRVADEVIGLGEDTTPTPGGRYYIKELLRPPDPNGIYGTYAYGLSGFSPVLQTFNGGDGTIGIHGTNTPKLLGQKISHGCIRMRNESISELAKYLPLGTPVIIRA